MNRADETTFAWALNDSARDVLTRDAHASLCAKIGAGEQDRAITELLIFYALGRLELPHNLAGLAAEWVAGYRGSDCETTLLAVIAAIRISPQIEAATARTNDEEQPPRRTLIACRSDRAVQMMRKRRRLATCSTDITEPTIIGT